MTKTPVPEKTSEGTYNWFVKNDLEWRVTWARKRVGWALWDFRMYTALALWSTGFSIFSISTDNTVGAILNGILAGAWAVVAYLSHKKLGYLKKELQIHIDAQKEAKNASTTESAKPESTK